MRDSITINGIKFTRRDFASVQKKESTIELKLKSSKTPYIFNFKSEAETDKCYTKILHFIYNIKSASDE